MPPITPSLDYSDKDFDALLARANQLIAAAFPEWSDKNVANFGNILVSLFCHFGDTIGFYQDKQARESRWTKASLRRSILSMVKLIGYSAEGATAAQATETFTLQTAMPADVTIPAGAKVSTQEVTAPTRYQLIDDLIIIAGQLSAQATVENSEFAQDFLASSGLPNQSFTLAKTPYLPDSLSIGAANGEFTQVDNFLQSTPASLHFTVIVDQNDRARVTFGNGINGAVPSGSMTAAYKTGGGAAGRVQPGALSKLEGAFTDAFGNSATITVTNALQSSGGFDRQTNASIKQLAPLSVRVSDKTVAREDYEIVAKRIAGVSRALMLTKNEDPSIGENAGYLFLVPPGAGVISQSVIDSVTAELVLTPYAPTFNLAIQTSAYLVVNVLARVYLTAAAAKTAESRAAAKASIVAAVGVFFEDTVSDPNSDDFGAANMAIDFGFYIKDSAGNPAGQLPLTDVMNAVRDVPAVRKLDPSLNGFQLNGLHADVTIANRQFPKLGTVTLIDATTGQAL